MTLRAVAILLSLALLAGCQTASQQANQQADQAMYQPIEYANQGKPGPQLVVIPGAVKSMNATFAQKYGPNNIADFAEIELSKDNFQVLERQDLGSMVQEIEVAANLGDANTLKKFKKGKMQATNWLVRFDVIRAEPVASAQRSFNGSYLGAIAGSAIGSASNSWVASTTADASVSSVHSHEASGVWIVGMRYKVLDANTAEQKATGYYEDKMEISSKGGGALGVSGSSTKSLTLDSLVQRLIQRCVADMDKLK
jgi:hypothetical protein